MKTGTFVALLFLSSIFDTLWAQNTPWDIIYCLNGGENKSAGISKLPVPNPAERPGWNLIFSDEFLNDSLDAAKWNRSIPGDDKPDTCLRGFAINPANIATAGGQAEIRNTIGSPLAGCPYSFGEIKTMSVLDTAFGSFYFYAPGFLETRVKLFTKPGQGAACWLWGIGTPDSPGTPGDWNEIDVFELNGINNNVFNGTYHWTHNGTHVAQNHKIYLTDSGQVYNHSENWTTFGLEWDTDTIKWFVNNQLVKALGLSGTPPFCIAADRYSQPVVPFCLRFNTGNNSVGNQSAFATPGDLPQVMLIDYVRVYKKTGVKAAPIALAGEPQICASAISPETTTTVIGTHFYPGVVYNWSSPAFEMLEINSPPPQPPGKRLIWIKPGVVPGVSYPVYLETRFPGNHIELDTAYIFIAPEAPELPVDDFSAAQIDSSCRFAILTTVPSGITGCEFSLNGGNNWNPAIIFVKEGKKYCSFGNFKPETMVDFKFRAQNSCGYSPVLSSSCLMPLPPDGCKWPTGMEDARLQTNRSAARVTISPNPVFDFLTVKLTGNEELFNSKLSYGILDLRGVEVATGGLQGRVTKINLMSLPNGGYIFQVRSEKSVFTQTLLLKY
jgi:hypothetical protein